MKFVLLFCLLPFFSFGQVLTRKDSIKRFSYKDETGGHVWGSVNLFTGDTITNTWFRRISKSKEGVILSEGGMLGGMGSHCGCVVKPHGYWIYRYRSGELKSQGTLYCRQKTGTWVYYYENGKISKVETYARSYPILTNDQAWETPNPILLKGAFLTFFSNGQLKTNGNYEILEVYSTVDTIFSLNPETYEEIKTVVHGEFWLPQSVKVGLWVEYDEHGAMIKKESFKKPEKSRRIEARYWDWIDALYVLPDSTNLEPVDNRKK